MHEQKQNCIFCKIINKEINADIVYEDNKFLAFLDINPVNKGHTLLIPKEHHEWIHVTPDLLLGDTFIKAKEIISKLIKSLDCDYVQVTVVGVEVPHLHLHLIPRKIDDKLIAWPHTKYTDEKDKQDYLEKIKNAL